MTVRVAQITDIHLTAEPGSMLHGVDTALTLTAIVTEIRQLARRPDVIIATGDLADDGSEATYQRLRELLSVLDTPVYTLPGNHDDISKMRAVFNGNGFFCTPGAKVGDWGLVFANSQVEGHSHGCINLADIRENISEFSGQPILVSLHHTPSRVCPSSGCQLENSVAFTELLNSHQDVKGVIAGHTHNDFEIDAGGHVQFTTPSTFAHATHAQPGESDDHDDFWASHSLDGSLQGFRVLDLFPEGNIESEVYWVRNAT